jgi:hypothetical protein
MRGPDGGDERLQGRRQVTGGPTFRGIGGVQATTEVEIATLGVGEKAVEGCKGSDGFRGDGDKLASPGLDGFDVLPN